MTRLLPGLDRDKGVDFEGLLPTMSTRALSDYILASFLPEKHKQYMFQLPLSGDLFGHPSIRDEVDPVSVAPKLRLNTARAKGRLILDNIDDEAALNLYANINTDLYKKRSALLTIEAVGRLVFDKLKVRRAYQLDIDSLKLNDVSLIAELCSDDEVRFSAGVEFIF